MYSIIIQNAGFIAMKTIYVSKCHFRHTKTINSLLSNGALTKKCCRMSLKFRIPCILSSTNTFT